MPEINNHELIGEYINLISEIYFTFLDSVEGFKKNKEAEKKIPHHQRHNAFEDGKFLFFDFTGKIKRNEDNGLNAISSSQMALCQIYNLWEDYYREKIAKLCGYPKKNDLLGDIFGELKRVRTRITHAKGIKDKTVDGISFISFSENKTTQDSIYLTKGNFHELLEKLLKEFSIINWRIYYFQHGIPKEHQTELDDNNKSN